MKNILGLDLGTNSIRWALIDGENHKIIKAGSRIIPMDAATQGAFEAGNLQSQASVRTGFRGTRRLYERAALRRERLLRVLNVLGFLPEHFGDEIDFTEHPGKFKNHGEPLLPYRRNREGKNEFIFNDSFQEMLADFARNQPDLVADGRKVPYDWTIYYLRKKALSKPIKREELAWIILNFNTKRGYYQLRGEEEETAAPKNEEYKVLEVSRVEQTDEDKKRRGIFWYEITYENGATQRKSGPVAPRKVGDKVELIVTTTIDRKGNEVLKLRAPKADDWTLMKKRSENAILQSGKQVGEFIYDAILEQPDVKIRGKLVRVIEREFYKNELKAILDKQKEFLPELSNRELYNKCIRELYQNNEAHIASIKDKDFTDFFVNDIIFYQRPLKSKKSEISDCPYEHYQYVDKETGEVVNKPIKCIPKSHPLYQEFRLWQFVQNLRIYQKEKIIGGKLKMDVDVTNDFLKSEEDIVALFDWLNERDSISQEQFLKYKPFCLGKNVSNYRWNYVEDKSYPCNETHYAISKCLAKIDGAPVLSTQQKLALWHILYSVDDVIELRKALASFATANGFEESSFVESFIKMKPFSSDYGAYSEKAIKKLLALMRTGKYWSPDAIDQRTRNRIANIIDGVSDESIATRVREKAIRLHDVNDFRYLPLWLACYVVYDRHSESDDMQRWERPEDIDDYLRNTFKQHSLRNPVVEQVLGETLRVVRDVWKTYGTIAEVHVEMGRDMKANANERKRRSESISRNERTNQRIRLLLQEFVNPEYGIEDVRPHSPSQQEILKIYEENALNNGEDVPDDIRLIADNLGNPTKSVSKSDMLRYRLWLEQKYLSPYTGRPIPLSKLFTPAYEIEHVIPQSRYFDDSLSNKVICESEVNKLKDRMLGYEFITKEGGRIIDGNLGEHIKIFTKDQYEAFVKQHYANNRTKMRKLLMEDIPDGFIERQLNDSRYIARKTIEILSKMVREENETEATSKNVIVTNGSITDRLKKDWGLNDVWNDIVAPRFERLNQLTGTNDYGQWVNQGGKRYFQINVPIAIAQGFSKKRIDHRHHAMDAIVIACATRDHVNYLNNKSAISSEKDMRYDLQHKLCEKVKTDAYGNYIWQFKKPWPTFTQDARTELTSIIVSFKQNLRVITKMTNYYCHYVDGKKVVERQKGSDGWAIRKSLHKATVSGVVRLQQTKKVRLAEALKNWHQIKDKDIRKAIKEVIAMYKRFDEKAILRYFKDRKYLVGGKDISRVEIYYLPAEADLSATRVSLDTSFDKKKIEKITDSGIRAILSRHLQEYKDDPKIAFTPDGIAEMNHNIKRLNNGHDHKPIQKVRVAEAFGMKFAVGYRGNKSKKFVEADKGTNLFFAVYADADGNRIFKSIPFNEAVERMKNNLPVAPAEDEVGNKLLFTLSPNDLVYIPEEGEHVDKITDLSRVYKMVSASGNQCFFNPYSIAYPIKDTTELGSNNKAEKSWFGTMIKQSCVKLSVSRLGFITKVY